ncbi:MAG: glycan-binding surface protein, partial [Lentisphaerota bacterium]
VKLNNALTSLQAASMIRCWGSCDVVDMKLDAATNVFIAGDVFSTGGCFPATPGAYMTNNLSGFSMFISKFNSSLSTLLASTFMSPASSEGGSSYCGSLALYSSGNVFPTGETSTTNFPTTAGSYGPVSPKNSTAYSSAFVSKFNSSLSSLLASTYVGGSDLNTDKALAIAVDASGSVYIAGENSSTNFPITAGVFDTTRGRWAYPDAFVSKLNNTLSALQASICLGGGSYRESAYGLAFDGAGNVVVVGNGSSLPITAGCYSNNGNGFVLRMNNTFTQLWACTYLPGSEYVGDVIVENGSNIVVAGEITYYPSTAVKFPAISGSYDTSFNGGYDSFVAKLSADLTANLVADITGPTNNSVFVRPLNLGVTALVHRAFVPQSVCTQVVFWAGAVQVGKDTTSPWTVVWTNMPAGLYAVEARAYCSNGVVLTSAVANVRAHNAPTVSITNPPNNTVRYWKQTNWIYAAASDDGTVTNVAFYRGATLIGNDKTSPYQYGWYNAPAGSNVVTARVWDNYGVCRTSAPIALIVTNGFPSVSLTAPAHGAVLYWKVTNTLSATASDPDGTVAQVQFYTGSTLIGSDTTSPYIFAWTNAPAGTHALSARVWDNSQSCRTSAAITVTITNGLPSVTLTAPTNGTVWYWKKTNVLSATASDPDGTVAQVQFYTGSTLIGSDATSPYSYNWINAPAGAHSLSARVWDNSQSCRTSAVITITITNGLPSVTLTAPTNGASLYWRVTNVLTATASDPDGTVAQVQFYTGSTLIGSDTTSPYSYNWINALCGVQSLTARVLDNSGACRTSAVAAVTVTNRPPTGSITNPANGSVYGQVTNLTIYATASDPDGSVSSVAFYAGASNLGSDTTSPYSRVWTNIKAGVYALTVRITDNSSQVRTSSVVSVTVTNRRPTSSISSPSNGAAFIAPASITINATASDMDGTVTQVVFYAGSSNVGADATSPYSVTWLNVGVGAYAFTARALDNSGGIGTSAVVNVTVNANQSPATSITSPANGALFTTVPASITINANATDSDGTVTQVLFFAGAANIGVDATSPYNCLWSGVGEGAYSLTTVAFDNLGAAHTSVVVTVTVRVPPVVTLTAPGSGSSFVAPANIGLAATATSGGTITQVAFYAGSTVVGIDTTSPYSYAWNGVSTGAYVLTARAWDNLGLASTSAVANITVVAPAPSAEYPTNGAPLYVNAAPSARKKINPRIYGVNIANWCQAYYLKLCTPMLTNARVSIVRYGATNIERYNWRNNRMYNVISEENQYVPTSWRAFMDWAKNDVKAEPFFQTAVFGQVASDADSNYYSYAQTSQDIIDWVNTAGTNVQVWGIGNEPFIAWKLKTYKGARTNGESYAYNDGAHGDQIYNEDIYHDTFFSNFIRVATAIRGANASASILGPTPANWWLYWGTDYSPSCPAKKNNPGAHLDDNGWYMMANPANQADPRIFPERCGSADVIGWEVDEITGKFNDNRNLCQFAKRMGEYAASHGGAQLCNYMDFHRYMNTANDAGAVQETRDLWDPDYQSYDKETGGSGTRTKILVRFNNIINHYYTNMYLSLSEYDFFYWQGHPDEMQISALGEMDYLGVFPRQNVQMACNWYIGEPDQSGGGYEHSADAAKQAMFKEDGEPNPKYWALKLMSTHFRDQSLQTVASDNSQFSIYAGLETSSSQLTVVAAYKGQYVPWWDLHNPGALIQGQGNSNAMIIVSNFTITGVSKVLRYGRQDPGIMMMAPNGVRVTNNTFCYEFEPLSIYLFQFHGVATPPAEQAPASYVNVHPKRLDFGPYSLGSEQVRHHDEHTGLTWYTTNYTHTIKISNTRNSNTAWQVSESCSWLAVVGPTSGVATVTDVIPLIVTNRSLAVGVYSANVQVVTAQGTLMVPVTMEVTPGVAQGEKQLFDAETKSLAHTWSLGEPYSIGFYDGHGNPEDMDGPYIYDFSMDSTEKSGVGGTTSMRIDFNRANGDNAGGKLYSAFGTYGHTNGTMVWVPTNGNPADYVFKFDIKTKTEGPGFTSTKLMLVISDFDGHKGKPKVGISSFKDVMELADGGWQTVSIPLNSLFYNWAYPSGQDGSYVSLNFANVKQVEFCPWVGAEDKRGTMWLDNLRIETVNASTNKYPFAVAGQSKRLIGTNETVSLTATNSYDPDGSIAAYAWVPSVGLSATNVANPTFTPPGPGLFTYELVVTDNK